MLAWAAFFSLAPPARRADACGGFFCNQPNGPDDQPVAQTAENVLFAMERAPSGQFQLEAHVQIFYTGPADRFSWVVPVDSEPTLGVGSNAVFTALLAATQPRFELEWRTSGTCRPSAPPPPPAAPAPAPPPVVSPPGTPGSGVAVSFRGNVGPYDAAILRSTDRNDPKPLIDWLALNKYFVTPEAVRLIEEYVRADRHFVAIRLQAERGVNEIEPLVMRFLGPGPCVPLKLTAIASIRDLRINLWVLADGRVVPDNFYEMEINPARIDWFNGGRNYEELVKEAADQAGGNAFITEFAGPASLLKGRLFQPGQYDFAAVAASANPPDALDRIGVMPFARDNTLLAILRTHIPVPARLVAMGIDERTFYNQLRLYWSQYQTDFAPFDAQALAAALEEKFVTAPRKIQALFDQHARLTRLSTFISPEEMTVDPTFVANPTLPDVPATRRAVATRVCGDSQYDACTAPVRLEAPGTDAVWFRPRPQPVCYGQTFDYDRAALDGMPALYRAWARTSLGEGAVRLDRRQTIGNAIRAHNAISTRNSPATPDAGRPGPGTRDGGHVRDGGHGGTPVTGSMGGGCGCQLGARSAGTALPLVIGAIALAIRRLRRRP